MLCVAMSTSQFSYQDDYVPTVQSLVFHKGQQTHVMKTSPVRQRKCHFGNNLTVSNCQEYDPDIINWKCEADIGDYFEFGAINIGCEDFNNLDKFILVNSCNLELIDKCKEFMKEHENDKYIQEKEAEKHISKMLTMIVGIPLIVLVLVYDANRN